MGESVTADEEHNALGRSTCNGTPLPMISAVPVPSQRIAPLDAVQPFNGSNTSSAFASSESGSDSTFWNTATDAGGNGSNGMLRPPGEVEDLQGGNGSNGIMANAFSDGST